MAIDPGAARVPVFHVGDRLRKAREDAQLGHSDLARDLGVSRNTITNYERGKVTPRRPVLVAWAMRTQVPVAWLETGDAPPLDGGGASLYAPWDSNPEPSDSEPGGAVRPLPIQRVDLAERAA